KLLNSRLSMGCDCALWAALSPPERHGTMCRRACGARLARPKCLQYDFWTPRACSERQSMKILQTRGAPNPRRVRIFLAEKGIEVPYEEIDLMKGELKTADFTKLNRFQRVPVLVLDDGTSLPETMAICRYFDETKPEPALFGTGALERAMVEMWNRRTELCLVF